MTILISIVKKNTHRNIKTLNKHCFLIYLAFLTRIQSRSSDSDSTQPLQPASFTITVVIAQQTTSLEFWLRDCLSLCQQCQLACQVVTPPSPLIIAVLPDDQFTFSVNLPQNSYSIHVLRHTHMSVIPLKKK